MRTKRLRTAPRVKQAWMVLATVIAVGVLLDVAIQISYIRRDKYLLDHRCRLVNYSGATPDQIYECDTGLMRLRDL